MSSRALETFNHAILDATDLLKHFDTLNSKPPPPDIEVLKRASLVLALTALETYFEDRLLEAVDMRCSQSAAEGTIESFYRTSLEIDLKSFHSPSTDKVRHIYRKYLAVDVCTAWNWNNCDPSKAKAELDRLVKKRGDIAHRSLRPTIGGAPPKQHAVTREELRKHIHFIKQMASATDSFLGLNL